MPHRNVVRSGPENGQMNGAGTDLNALNGILEISEIELNLAIKQIGRPYMIRKNVNL